jgi:cell shape-determining protein MreC
MAADELPLWVVPPLRATQEEKAEHQRKRSVEEAHLLPKLQQMYENQNHTKEELGVTSDQAYHIVLGRFLRARRYVVCFSFF